MKNVERYLERINYHGSVVPNAETLRDLQLAHLTAVPFENLSIHHSQPIVLDDDSLYEKIVTRRRGGFCYELNGLFAALLRELGFKVDMLSAGVANSEKVFGPDFDHMTLLVSLDKRWLADVGFGDSFREPLLLDETGEQVQGNRTYKIMREDEHLTLWQREGSGEWTPQYRFSLTPHVFEDYKEMCRYQETSPESHFTQKRVCTRATPDGRITLSEMKLITTVGDERSERVLANDDEYTSILRDVFGIERSTLVR